MTEAEETLVKETQCQVCQVAEMKEEDPEIQTLAEIGMREEIDLKLEKQEGEQQEV